MIEIIKEKKPKVPYWFLFRHFAVSSSNFFYWKKDNQSETLTFNKKSKILSYIKDIFNTSKSTYGSPRIYRELEKLNIAICENTVAKYMKELGLDARLKKKYRVQTTDSKHSHPIADRLFKVEDEDSLPKAPGLLLAGDITYLKLSKNSHIYLSVVLDLYNREVVGWSISDSLETGLVLKALENAMHVVGPDAKVIFHSDRGLNFPKTVGVN